MENYAANSFYHQRVQRRKRKRRLTFLVLFTIIFIALFTPLVRFLNKDEVIKISSGQTKGASLVTSEIFPSKVNQKMEKINPKISTDSSLPQIVSTALEGTKGTYSVAIKNLKTNETYFLNEHQTYDAGSLYKLWVMVVTFNKIQAGELEKDQTLSQGISTLNSKFGIDPAFAEQTEGTITLSVAEALKQMITISHNYAALLLTEKVRLSTVANFLKSQNFKESKVGTDGNLPTTTATDVLAFMEKLYKGELADKQYTQEMMDLLRKQQLNNKLPRYLPFDVEVAHKTGEIDRFSHDAGIVYAPTGDYIMVAMSESDSPQGAEERIAVLSKAVYQYFRDQDNR